MREERTPAVLSVLLLGRFITDYSKYLISVGFLGGVQGARVGMVTFVSLGIKQCPDGARGQLGSCGSYGPVLISVMCCQSLVQKGLRCFCVGKKMKHWFII